MRVEECFFQPRVDFGHLKSCCVKRKEEEKKKKKSARVKVCDSETRKPTQAEIDDSKSILCSISRSVFCLEFTRVCSSVSSLRRA